MCKSIIIVMLMIVIMFMVSCAPASEYFTWDQRDQALQCGLVASMTHETRIEFNPSELPRQWRAHAKTKINGEWQWLKMGYDGKCYAGEPGKFKLLNDFTVEDYKRLMESWDKMSPELRLPGFGKF